MSLGAEPDAVGLDRVAGGETAQEAQRLGRGRPAVDLPGGVEHVGAGHGGPLAGEQLGGGEHLGGDDPGAVGDDDAALAGQRTPPHQVRCGGR